MKRNNMIKQWPAPTGAALLSWALISACSLGAALLFDACAYSPQKKGTVTTEMRGARLLTDKGDQLMQTGVYSKREVSADFAEGYEKGLSDTYKRWWWSMQDAQRWTTHFWDNTRPDKTGRRPLERTRPWQ